MAPKFSYYLMLFTLLLFPICLAAEESIKPLEIGSAAPNFNLPGIDGKNYTLNNFNKAEILVVIFTANHCPTAQAYENRIMQLVADYEKKSVAVVCISSNSPEALRLDEMGYSDLGDTFEEMKIRAKDKGFNFPFLYDGDTQTVGKAYGAQATPHVFVFDKARELRYTGRFDDSEKPEKITSHDTRNAIDALLAGKPAPVAVTKSFGCSIKWASKKESAKKALEKWNAEPVTLEKIGLAGIKKLIQNDSENLRLLNVWATWCGPCVAEFPELIAINRMYRYREFEMVTLSADDPEIGDKVLKFLQKNHASGKNYHFELDDVYKLIEAVDPDWQGALPYTLLIKPGGKISYKKQGMIDPLEVKKAIVEELGRYYK